jgi:uncharacterized RDD family membrane protein YckC
VRTRRSRRELPSPRPRDLLSWRDLTDVGNQETGPRYYARASIRVRAALTDSLLIGISLLALLLLFEGLHTPGGVAVPLFYTWAAAVLVYEPVLVSWRGATIGHTLNNLVVLDRRTGRPPPFLRALVRTFIKNLLGLVSFVAMSLTRRHQALHDLATGTVVEIVHPERASRTDAVVK